jgi:hypothetical protein
MATGAAVSEDESIFPRLAESMRKVLGIEMEASALGALGNIHNIPVLVAKGVSDYGDSFKDDRYREFAARAAAECLIDLLRNAVDLLPPSKDNLSTVRTVLDKDNCFDELREILKPIEQDLITFNQVCYQYVDKSLILKDNLSKTLNNLINLGEKSDGQYPIICVINHLIKENFIINSEWLHKTINKLNIDLKDIEYNSIKGINYLTIELNRHQNNKDNYSVQAWLNDEKIFSENSQIFMDGDIKYQPEEVETKITPDILIQNLLDSISIGKPLIEFFVPQELMYYHFEHILYENEPVGINFRIALRSVERIKRKEEIERKKMMNLCFENWIEHWNRIENKIHQKFKGLKWLGENQSGEIRNLLVNNGQVFFALDFQVSETHEHLKKLIKGGTIAALWSCKCDNFELMKEKMLPFLDDANVINLPEKIYEFRCSAEKPCVTLFLDTPDRPHPEQLNPTTLTPPTY